MIQDLTAGHPTRQILKFALPLFIGNLVQQLYQITDIIIVGRLIGVEALAAVGASAPLFFMILLITFGFTSGLTVITAQRFGAKDYKGVRRSVTHGIMACATLGLTLTAAMMLWLRPILILMNVPADILENAYIFIHLLCMGLMVILGYNLLSAFIRALGDSKTPLYFLIFASCLNILLNFIFIYYFQLGVAGSAFGTIIAISVSFACCLWYIAKKFPILHLSRNDWKYDSALMKQHLAIAVPMSLQFSILAVGLMIIQVVCNSLGSETIAAFTAALRIEQLSTQPLIAVGLAIATYTAQNYGAGMITRIRRGVFNCSLISLSFSLTLALLVRFVGENMIEVFIKDGNPAIIQTAKDYLNISTMFYCFLGQIFIFRNAVQGMGYSIIPLIASIVELAMRSFAAVFLAGSLGYIGLCYASPIAWIGASLVVSTGYIWVIRRLRRQHLRNHLRWLSYRLNLKKAEAKPGVTIIAPAE